MSAKHNFKVGDVVELKSGGPLMTVSEINAGHEADEIECQWFGGKKLEVGRFPPESLVAGKQEEK